MRSNVFGLIPVTSAPTCFPAFPQLFLKVAPAASLAIRSLKRDLAAGARGVRLRACQRRPRMFSRRQIGYMALGGLLLPATARAAALSALPSQTEGPYYHDVLPGDTDNDLVRIADAARHARSEEHTSELQSL